MQHIERYLFCMFGAPYFKGIYYGKLINHFIPGTEKHQMIKGIENAYKEWSYEKGNPLVGVDDKMEDENNSVKNRKYPSGNIPN